MAKISRSIAILAGVVFCAVFLAGISGAKRIKTASYGQAEASTGSTVAKREVLVEAIIVEVSADALGRLRIGPNMEPLSEVTVSLPVLLYVLAAPNAAKTITSAKIKV